VLTDDGRALLVGLFNSTWGNIPAAVSWQAIRQQASDDVRSALSAQATPQPPAT